MPLLASVPTALHMDQPNWADVLSGVGQAVEAIVVIVGTLYVVDELKKFKAEKRTETNAVAAGALWIAVSEVVTLLEALNKESMPGFLRIAIGGAYFPSADKSAWITEARRIAAELERTRIGMELFHDGEFLKEAWALRGVVGDLLDRLEKDRPGDWRFDIVSDAELVKSVQLRDALRAKLKPIAAFH